MNRIRTIIAWPFAVVGALALLASLAIELGSVKEARRRLSNAGDAL